MADDDLSPLVTECPNCSTRFRVTEVQLQVAAGRVRCGACLNVFQGTDFLYLDGEPYSPQTADTSISDLDAVLDELGGSGEEEATLAGEDEAPDLSALNLKPIRADEDLESDHVPNELNELEAELLEGLREEVHSTPRKEPVVGPPAEAVEADPQTSAHEDELESVSPDAGSADEVGADDGAEDTDAGQEVVGQEDAGQEEDVAAELATELDSTAEGLGPAEKKGAPDQSLEEAWVDDVEEEVWDETEEELIEETAGFDAGELSDREAEPVAQAAEPVVPAAALPDPAYDLEEEPRSRPWITYALIVIAAIALPSQVLWYQFDRWSVDPDVRPVYATICGIIGCSLPQMTNVARIEARETVVRSHPRVQDALVVDVLMVNNAEFDQPYPVVELSFRTLDGGLVAGRRFKPHEYLAGEANATDLMPQRTPIHVSLEVEDPGEEAVNYNVNFL